MLISRLPSPVIRASPRSAGLEAVIVPRHRFAIGERRSSPKARGVSRVPGAAWNYLSVIREGTVVRP